MRETDRIETLKENLTRLVRVERVRERPTILTDTIIEQEPLPIRKAKALAGLLSQVPVYIYPEELIVGIPLGEEPSPAKGDGSINRGLPPEGVSGFGYITRAKRHVERGLSDESYDPVIIGLQGYGAS
jgi:hypothetical protein